MMSCMSNIPQINKSTFELEMQKMQSHFTLCGKSSLYLDE